MCLSMDPSIYLEYISSGVKPHFPDFSVIMRKVAMVEFAGWLIIQVQANRRIQHILSILISIFALYTIPWDCAIHNMPFEMRWYRLCLSIFTIVEFISV